jgi:hypothetical protein
MLAPKPGNELRSDLRNRLQSAQDTLTNAAAQRAETVSRGV